MSDNVETTMIERAPVAPNVPDLLKVSPMETSTVTDVETSILDPVIINQTTCRFVLSNKGVLHSHSKITLGLSTPGADDRFFAPNIGIAQIVQRCRLMVGTKTLQEIDGFLLN
jgi:hypothetical protein